METPDTVEQVDVSDIDLSEPIMHDELTITLTRAQLIIIKGILSEHIQPKGYEHIAFAYDLFTRLSNAILTQTTTDTEAFE
tara:strand:+ start:236 stop:478 length:243 start_codon:yes stop_codon:yes gene_type:complete